MKACQCGAEIHVKWHRGTARRGSGDGATFRGHRNRSGHRRWAHQGRHADKDRVGSNP
ncbi:hypothetical protein BC827DRAFT_1223335, partial [Russula dissimulans]